MTRCAAPVSGHLLDIGAGNTEGFTAGSIAFLVLNAFLIILGKSQNHVGCLLRGIWGQIMNPPVVALRWRCSSEGGSAPPGTLIKQEQRCFAHSQ